MEIIEFFRKISI